jgi:hypothetical protein
VKAYPQPEIIDLSDGSLVVIGTLERAVMQDNRLIQDRDAHLREVGQKPWYDKWKPVARWLGFRVPTYAIVTCLENIPGTEGENGVRACSREVPYVAVPGSRMVSVPGVTG